MAQLNSLLQVEAITKSFSGIQVLHGVSFELRPAEVHALMGENGAGKSTLMKIVAGLHPPDAGNVWLAGRELPPGNPHAALKAGVAMIYQELLPWLDLTVAENIHMGHEPASRFFGWLDRRTMRQQTQQILSRLGVSLSPDQKLRNLPVAELQVVEIAKALAHDARVIIMDEPTSALSEREAAALFRIIRGLRDQSVAIVFISHKLEEVFQLADRITVLRDGCHIATAPVHELTHNRLIKLMVGRELPSTGSDILRTPPDGLHWERRHPCQQASEPIVGGDAGAPSVAHPAERHISNTHAQPAGPSPAASGSCSPPPPYLSVRRLSRTPRFRSVTFDLHPGEILGLAGLMGAGRTDLLNAIYGLAPSESGEIQVGGYTVRIRSPRHALRAGIALISEDRKLFGLVPTLGVRANITLAALRRWSRAGFICRRAEKNAAEQNIRTLRIRTPHPDQLVERLSGGNQQKVVVARALLTQPNILLLDEPTRGIDIAAKAEIHALIAGLARTGKAILLVSSEMPELFALSHRLLVMRQGEVVAGLDPKQTTPEHVLKLAMPK